jgi:ABC-type enterobactin transport system permease subunit
VGVVISFAISAALRIPLVQALTAIGLTAALALSGLLFRSFGKEDDRSGKE